MDSKDYLIDYLNLRVATMQKALEEFKVENLALKQKLEYYQASHEINNQQNFIYGNF